MAGFGIVDEYTNILSGGVSTWQIMSSKSGQIGPITLDPITDASVDLATLNTVGKRKQEKPFGYALAAKCRILGTSKTTCLQKLDRLSDYTLLTYILAENGRNISAEMGVSWEFVVEGGMNANRYIDFSQGTAGPLSEIAAMIADFDVEGVDPADYLFGFSPGTIYPAGFLDLSIRNAGETVWETPGVWSNSSFRAKLNAFIDDRGRMAKGTSVDVTIGFDMAQTDSELDLLATIAAAQTDYKATLSEGTIITLADVAGLTLKYTLPPELEKEAVIRVTGSCSLTPAEFVARIS